MYLTPWSRLIRERLVRSRRRRRRRVPQVSSLVEQLEDRTLLSAASFADGVFAFTSDAGLVNNVTVSESGGLVTIRDTAATITPSGSVQQGVDANEVTFATSQVTKVQLDLDDGDDTAVATGLAIALLVNAGDGADSITGGDAGDTLNGGNDGDLLVGGGGDDKLNGSGGDDVLQGDAGQDTVSGGGGEDTLEGGEGNDLVRGQGSEDTLSGGAGDDTIDGGPAYDQLRETADVDFTITDTSLTGVGNDVLVDFEETYLTGGSSPNTFDGTAFDGRVIVNAKGGNDTMLGGDRADRLLGGSGRDLVRGGVGNDVVRG
ncbi:MAG: calcium-binding protein, partial [Planctomycetota bacterium]|nr:calcium-binding protein [Planctomycetota bacterium]